VIQLGSPLSQLPRFWDGLASVWAKQQATRQLQPMQLAQPVTLPLPPFCACDVSPGKPTRQAKVIER
jgi:hypothetical protein